MIKKTVVLFLVAVILCFIPVSAAAESNFAFDGIGVVFGSYHFNNDGSHAWRTPTSHYNEFNPGLTAYFKVKSFPLIDKIGITYILKKQLRRTFGIYLGISRNRQYRAGSIRSGCCHSKRLS